MWRARRERLLLWLPVIGKHVITPESPIASWATPAGLMADADAAIVVVVRAAASGIPREQYMSIGRQFLSSLVVPGQELLFVHAK